MYNKIIRNFITLATTIVALVLLAGWLLFARQPTALASPFAQDATPTPAAEEEHTHSHEEAATDVLTETVASDEAAEPTLHELAQQIKALQAEIDALKAGDPAEVHAEIHAEASANEILTAIYLLDTVGLHDLSVRLVEEKVIQPADAGAVSRIARLLSTVDWPESLATDAEALIATLAELATALSDDDLDAATPLADAAHEAQHDLSHAATQWVDESADTHEAMGEDTHSHDAAAEESPAEEAGHDHGAAAEHTHASEPISDTHTLTDTHTISDTHGSGG